MSRLGIGIVDYGVGNHTSVWRTLYALSCIITSLLLRTSPRWVIPCFNLFIISRRTGRELINILNK